MENTLGLFRIRGTVRDRVVAQVTQESLSSKAPVVLMSRLDGNGLVEYVGVYDHDGNVARAMEYGWHIDLRVS